MGQHGDGFDSGSTPPSFIPASTRKRRAQDVTPHGVPTPQGARAETPHGAPQGTAAAREGLPRFAPASPRRSTSSSSAARPSHPSQNTPAGDRTPRSFPPSGDAAGDHSQRYSRAASDQRPHPRSTRPSQPHAAAPYRPSGSSPSGSQRNQQSAARTYARPRRLLIALIVLLAALAVALFGAWNWVDSRLNKSDWLPGTPNTAGTAWLILGSDERDGSTGQDGTIGARTDTLLVLTKPSSGPSSLISIPRDSLVHVNDEYMKINAVYQISKKTLVSQIETITGQHIDHVAEIQFGGLKSVVNALGGVRLCYDQTVDDENSGMNWQAGCHIADGDTALAFSRMRYSDPNGDFGRAARQRQVIAAIVSKTASVSTLRNFSTVNATARAGLAAVKVDNQTNPYTLLTMAMAFRDATGGKGVTGSLYWSDPDYVVDGVGSTVLLDDAKNRALFDELAHGKHQAGTVGTLAASSGQ